MKKVFFSLLLVFCLFSCTQKKESKNIVFAFSQFSLDDSWSNAMLQSMQIESKFYNDVKLIYKDGEGSVDKQIEDIETFINQKVDVLIITPIAPKPLKATIKKAIKNNIPVIILDRKVEGVDYNVFIGTDNEEVGQNSAKYLASLKSKLDIIEVKGWAGTTPTLLRSKGFDSIVKTNDNLNIVGVVQDIYDSPGIRDRFLTVLKQNPNTNVVFAHTDALAYQAYEASKELELHDKIKFIGVGGVSGKNEGLDLVDKNILESTILYPTGGKEAIRIAKVIVEKQPVDKEYLLPSLVINSDNVNVLKRQSELIIEQQQDIEKQQVKMAKQIQLFASQNQYLKFTSGLLALIGLLLFRTYSSRSKIDKQRKIVEASNKLIASQKEKIEKIAEDLRITNQATTNFFTGVSHDFKTPVSLITSSIQSLLKENSKEKKPKEYQLIYNNSKRLLRMIVELLDFKKVENNEFKIKASKINIYDFIYSIYLDFETEAEQKEINFSIETNDEDAEVYLDRNLFDNVMFNLLSNAFKFTPVSGEIKIVIYSIDDKVNISVEDSGIGIINSEKEKVFQQFFQGSNNNQTSSGIGLYITKKYINLHGGDISVESCQGKGACFRFYIPKGKNHFKADEIIVDDQVEENDTIQISDYDFETTPIKSLIKDKTETILIIEDNSDLRAFLKLKLSEYYNIYESDGIDAIEKAFEIIPDVIISDVNLPDKNGFEIVETLKKDVKTSHIPSIMLTALSSDQAHVKGLKSGVDIFLTKPFNLSVLHQSIESLLYNRKKIQHFYNQNKVSSSAAEEVKVNEVDVIENVKEEETLDKVFLNTIDKIIEERIEDSDFNVEELADKLQISRVQLYRKTKALLGIGINDYIQNTRLEKSKILLADKSLSIADVAYSAGFSSPNYFSTAFKNKYGKTPNKFRKTI